MMEAIGIIDNLLNNLTMVFNYHTSPLVDITCAIILWTLILYIIDYANEDNKV